jgi:hypothetical protein
MDSKKITLDAKKSLDSVIGGVHEDELDDDKHNVDPLQFVEVKTEVKVSYSFSSVLFSFFCFPPFFACHLYKYLTEVCSEQTE